MCGLFLAPAKSLHRPARRTVACALLGQGRRAWAEQPGAAVRVEGSWAHFSHLSPAGITLYSHPYGGALLNEDKM